MQAAGRACPLSALTQSVKFVFNSCTKDAYRSSNLYVGRSLHYLTHLNILTPPTNNRSRLHGSTAPRSSGLSFSPYQSFISSLPHRHELMSALVQKCCLYISYLSDDVLRPWRGERTLFNNLGRRWWRGWDGCGKCVKWEEQRSVEGGSKERNRLSSRCCSWFVDRWLQDPESC